VDPKGWDKDFQGSNPEPPETLLTKGCKRAPLLTFLAFAHRTDYYSRNRKGELDQLKRDFGRLIRQSERLGKALREVANQFFPIADDTSEFLRSAADWANDYTAELQSRKKLVAEQRSVRTTSPLLDIVPLCLYCEKASHGQVTDREIVDFINAGRSADPNSPGLISPQALRAQLKRTKANSPEHYSILEALMEKYVASSDHKRFTFGSWLHEMRLSGNLSIEVHHQ
jgi:hypothetical protein